MRRPVVNKDIVDYMRTHLQENKGHLAELEAFARKENIPIIQHEVVAYFRFLLQTLQPKKILEVGTAIGFSALLMAEYAPDAQITTVDRNEEMISFAKENLAKYDSRKQITLVEGDAAEVLQDLDTDYDFVFMDSAKSKYIVFLPEILKRLKVVSSSLMISSKGAILPKTSWRFVVVSVRFIVACIVFLMRP